MAHVLNDRVKETTTTTGTGTIDLGGAETGFETFVQAIGNSNTTYYAIAHQSANEFEIGIGTVTDASPDTLSRTTVISSTNSDSLVDFSAGTKDVFCTLPASKAVFFDDSSGSSDVAIGSRGTNPMGLSMVGTVLALTEQTNVASFQMDGAQASRIDMGSGPGTRQFVIYTDTANYSSLERKDAKPIVFATDNTERFRILQGGGIQLAAGNNISNASGDFTLDIAGDITLDADGGDILFKDGGTLVGTIGGFSGNNVTIKSEVSDGDIIFQGNDGGTAISPLRIDMSAGGRALFSSDLLALETAGQYLQMKGSGSTYWAIGSTGGNNPPGTASTSLAFHHYDGSNWNNEVEFDSAGNIVADGNITAYSDERLKDNIETIENGLAKVSELRGVSYTKDNKKSIGVIAQEVEKVLPEVVITGSTEDKFKSVDYGRLTAVLIEAIKEQQEQIDTLNDYVKLQSATIMDMERRLNELEDK